MSLMKESVSETNERAHAVETIIASERTRSRRRNDNSAVIILAGMRNSIIRERKRERQRISESKLERAGGPLTARSRSRW